MFKRFFQKGIQDAIGSLINEAFTMRGFGQPVFNKTNQKALIKNGYQGNADVYSIINYISTLASNVQWTISEVKDEKALGAFKNYDIYDAKAMFLELKAMHQLPSHPVLDVMNNPNSLQTGSEWVHSWCGFKLITGEAFINGIRPAIGINNTLIQEMHIMPSQFMKILPGNRTSPVRGYQLDVGGVKPIPFEPEDVSHSKYFNPDFKGGQSLHGMAPLQAAGRTLTSSNDADTARVRAFQNQGAVGMISSGSTDENIRMSGDELKGLSDKYQEKFGGPENFNKILFTTANAKWDNMGLSPVDMAILESKVHDLRTLCNIYSVQSQIFNDPANKRDNNQREGKKAAMTDAVMPLLNSLRDELNLWLVPAYEKKEGRKLFLSPDWKSVAVLQEDMEKLVNWLLKSWWLTPNQRLRLQGIEESTDPNMSNVFIPRNLVELVSGDTPTI